MLLNFFCVNCTKMSETSCAKHIPHHIKTEIFSMWCERLVGVKVYT